MPDTPPRIVDLHAVSGADLVLIMKDGEIVEQGGHADLLSRSLHYRRLHKLKTSRNEAGEA